MDRNHKIVIIAAIVLGVSLSLYYQMQYGHIADNEAHRLLTIIYGGLLSLDGLNFFLTLVFSLPFFIQLLLLADIINKDFDMASVYIFPRKNTRIKWLLSKFKDIFINSFYFYLVQFAVVLGLSLFFGYKFNFINIIIVILLLLITYVIMNSLFVMIAAVSSIKNKTSIIFPLIFTLYFTWYFLLPIVKGFPLLFKFIPFSHALLFFHSLPIYINNIWNEVQFNGYISIWSTVMYSVSGIILISFISVLWFKKVSLMEGNY